MKEEKKHSVDNQKIFLLVGASGSGKTSSMRNMPLEKTALLNTEQKTMLPFRGAKRLYKHGVISNVDTFMPALDVLIADEKVEYIVLDSLSFLLNMFEMQKVRTAVNTMKAWGDYGAFYKEIIHKIKASKKNFVIMVHPKEFYDEKSQMMITNAFSKGSNSGFIEADFNVVVYTDNYIDEDGMPGYRFLVKKTKESLGKSVKSPFDMFDSPYTKSNDIMEVFEAIEKYIEGE